MPKKKPNKGWEPSGFGANPERGPHSGSATSSNGQRHYERRAIMIMKSARKTNRVTCVRLATKIIWRMRGQPRASRVSQRMRGRPKSCLAMTNRWWSPMIPAMIPAMIPHLILSDRRQCLIRSGARKDKRDEENDWRRAKYNKTAEYYIKKA